MSRFDLLSNAIAGADRDSDDILTLFGGAQGSRELPRYSTHTRRRARARRIGR